MIYTRKLKKGSYGEDVLYIKSCLLSLGYYAPEIKSVSSKTFRADSVRAVQAFQKAKGLLVDGEIDPATWAAIVKDYTAKQPPKQGAKNAPLTAKDAPALSAEALAKINTDLATVSEERFAFVKLALAEAYDPASGPRRYPLSLYIRGGNLYNKDLTRNIISKAKLEEYLAKKDYAQYVAGREDVMREAVAQQSTSGADCSGGIVGIGRKTGKIKPSTDATANGLCGSGYSRATTKARLVPGDFVGKTGHIGLYVGGGYVVEWVGGAYGCQLTALNKRTAYCFSTYASGKTIYVAGTTYKQSAWTKFRTPLWFKEGI